MIPQCTGCRRKKSDGEWFSQALNGRFLQFALISSVSPQNRFTFHPIYQDALTYAFLLHFSFSQWFVPQQNNTVLEYLCHNEFSHALLFLLLLFISLKCTSTDTLFFQNREAQSEMPQEAAVQAGCTNRSTTLMSLSQNEAWVLSA